MMSPHDAPQKRPSIPTEDSPVYTDWEEANTSPDSKCCACGCKAVSKNCCLMFSVVMNFLLTCVVVGIAIYFLLLTLDVGGLNVGNRLCKVITGNVTPS